MNLSGLFETRPSGILSPTRKVIIPGTARPKGSRRPVINPKHMNPNTGKKLRKAHLLDQFGRMTDVDKSSEEGLFDDALKH